MREHGGEEEVTHALLSVSLLLQLVDTLCSVLGLSWF